MALRERFKYQSHRGTWGLGPVPGNEQRTFSLFFVYVSGSNCSPHENFEDILLCHIDLLFSLLKLAQGRACSVPEQPGAIATFTFSRRKTHSS